MTQIYLIRHGEPDYTPVDSRGWPGMAADTAPLSPEGTKQAEALADLLSGIGATYLVSSPFTRALHSAAIIGHRLALGVRVDYDLRDWLPDSTGWVARDCRRTGGAGRVRGVRRRMAGRDSAQLGTAVASS